MVLFNKDFINGVFNEQGLKGISKGMPFFYFSMSQSTSGFINNLHLNMPYQE